MEICRSTLNLLRLPVLVTDHFKGPRRALGRDMRARVCVCVGVCVCGQQFANEITVDLDMSFAGSP